MRPPRHARSHVALAVGVAVLAHGAISFFSNTVILALAVNAALIYAG